LKPGAKPVTGKIDAGVAACIKNIKNDKNPSCHAFSCGLPLTESLRSRKVFASDKKHISARRFFV